jgi:hypothetical protein
MTYSTFWGVVKDFQSLIGALVSLIAVVCGILGILLKARIDSYQTDRRLREERRDIALSLSSMLRMEGYFQESTLLRIPSEAQVFAMLNNIGNTAIGINSYIGYFTKFVSTLSGFPSPVADRAHFLSWVSARTALALAAVHNAEQSDREAIAHAYAPEVRMLLIAAIIVLDELDDELTCYEQSQDTYEKEWRQRGLIETQFRGRRSRRFDVNKLNVKIWEVALKPSDGLRSAQGWGMTRRAWLEELLEKIDKRVPEDRKEVYSALEAIYKRCNKLPDDSAERQMLERLVVAIWKRGEEKINEEDVWKMDQATLGLISDLGKQAARSWRL